MGGGGEEGVEEEGGNGDVAEVEVEEVGKSLRKRTCLLLPSFRGMRVSSLRLSGACLDRKIIWARP
jgi:hypothetical protein